MAGCDTPQDPVAQSKGTNSATIWSICDPANGVWFDCSPLGPAEEATILNDLWTYMDFSNSQCVQLYNEVQATFAAGQAYKMPSAYLATGYSEAPGKIAFNEALFSDPRFSATRAGVAVHEAAHNFYNSYGSEHLADWSQGACINVA